MNNILEVSRSQAKRIAIQSRGRRDDLAARTLAHLETERDVLTEMLQTCRCEETEHNLLTSLEGLDERVAFWTKQVTTGV